MWTTPSQITPAPPPTEESCPFAEYTPHTEAINSGTRLTGVGGALIFLKIISHHVVSDPEYPRRSMCSVAVLHLDQ